MKYIISAGYIRAIDVMILVPSDWDDYSFKTSFEAKYFTPKGECIDLGTVKIGKRHFEGGRVRDFLENPFTELASDCFSLWQSAESYLKVRKVEEEYNLNIFEELNDLAYNLLLFEEFEGETVVEKSLLRFVSKHMCVNQFHRISLGERLLSSYNFDYIIRQNDDLFNDTRLDFSVEPNSLPPTNIHAIIGSNGTGKTTLIKNMIKSICNNDDECGQFTYELSDENELGYFESVMCISFSPFDDYSDVESCKNFTYIGVRKEYSEKGSSEMNLLSDIRKKFLDSYKNCMSNKTKRNDWVEMVRMFGNDGDYLFSSYRFAEEIYAQGISSFENTSEIEKIFDRLSAGHKEVLSIITRCIDQLAEKTILFVDEPENHLHPPLLSTLIRGLSQMLIKRNGVAIISTHSPIVLQEIPKSCVWILNRQGRYLFGNRPENETFGTNVGVLTNEVFGYEVKKSGFNMMLQSSVNKCSTYEEVLEEFNYQLGNEAKSMVRILFSQKER